MSQRLTDHNGNTVEVARLNGREVFVARAANGILLGRRLGDQRELTTPADLVAAGIDLGSLK
jgi:hypothetical protein